MYTNVHKNYDTWNAENKFFLKFMRNYYLKSMTNPNMTQPTKGTPKKMNMIAADKTIN
jgi:hypothetical protein